MSSEAAEQKYDWEGWLERLRGSRLSAQSVHMRGSRIGGPLASPVPLPLYVMVSLIAQDHHLFTCRDFAHKEMHKQLAPVTIVWSG